MADADEGNKKKIHARSFILFCHRLAATLLLIGWNEANGTLLREEMDGCGGSSGHLMLSRQSSPECTQLKGKMNVFPRKTVGC